LIKQNRLYIGARGSLVSVAKKVTAWFPELPENFIDWAERDKTGGTDSRRHAILTPTNRVRSNVSNESRNNLPSMRTWAK